MSIVLNVNDVGLMTALVKKKHYHVMYNYNKLCVRTFFANCTFQTCKVKIIKIVIYNKKCA